MRKDLPRIGHVHLKVRDIEHSIQFYTDLLGLSVTERVGKYVFLSYGDEHHDIALNEVGPHAPSPGENAVGLYHLAIEVPTETALKSFYHRLRGGDVVVSLVDHGISKTLYLSDPDGNGIEVYVDTRRENDHGLWRGRSVPFDPDSLARV